FRRTGIDDTAEPDPSMRGGAHGAVFARGVDRGPRSLFRAQILRRPPGNRKFGMPGVIASRNSIAIFEQHFAMARHQYRPEGFIAGFERGFGQVHAPTQMDTILFTDHPSPPQSWGIRISRRKELPCQPPIPLSRTSVSTLSSR